MQVYVVYEGPDMTYYGDATLHGAYSTREQAEAKARDVWAEWHPNWRWSGEGWENVYVGELEIDEDD